MNKYYKVKLTNQLQAMTNDLPALINYLIDLSIDDAHIVSIDAILLDEYNEGGDFYYPELNYFNL
jgi:hypothetical protein